MSEPFGGFRGLFAAHLLKKMEEAWRIDWVGRFGLLAGTSTGSILTAGLASGVSAADLTEFYKTHGKAIFAATWSRFDILKLCTSRYSSRTLKDLLDDVFRDKTLGDIDVPLVLPSVDIGNGCVHVLKSKYHGEFVRDQNVRASDAILASCSAPTYFDPHVVNDTYQLVEGASGLTIRPSWQPSMSIIDWASRLKISASLPLARGKARRSTLEAKASGKTSWFAAGRDGDSQPDGGENPLKPKRVLRVTFESDQPLPMDSTEKRHDWIAKADHVFTHNAARISEFLSIERSSK